MSGSSHLYPAPGEEAHTASAATLSGSLADATGPSATRKAFRRANPRIGIANDALAAAKIKNGIA